MPDYSYLAVDTSGREVHGRVAGTDRGSAIALLQQRGLFPLQVAPVGGGSRGAASGQGRLQQWRVTGKGRVTRAELSIFTTQLANLVSAGLPIERCLEVLARQSKTPALASTLGSVLEELRAGEQMSAAMSQHAGAFPGFYVQMIKAGEVSGQLDAVLTNLASYLEKDEARRAQVRSALAYPTFLLLLATGAVGFIITFVIPRLTMIFADFGQELPFPTRLLLSTSGWLVRWGWLLALAAAALVLAARRALQKGEARLAVDAWRLRLPLFGLLAQKIVVARFARTLGTLVLGGVPLLDALAIVQKSLGNAAAARLVERARGRVREGEQIAKSLDEQNGVFPPVAIDMIGVGEETGHLEAMLLKLAEIYDLETDNSLKRMLSLLEPVIILGMGVVVGAVVISVLLPIFDLDTNF